MSQRMSGNEREKRRGSKHSTLFFHHKSRTGNEGRGHEKEGRIKSARGIYSVIRSARSQDSREKLNLIIAFDSWKVF